MRHGRVLLSTWEEGHSWIQRPFFERLQQISAHLMAVESSLRKDGGTLWEFVKINVSIDYGVFQRHKDANCVA
ncbi:hypothetical protein VB005_01705 [Metarhizium brunneum]